MLGVLDLDEPVVLGDPLAAASSTEATKSDRTSSGEAYTFEERNGSGRRHRHADGVGAETIL